MFSWESIPDKQEEAKGGKISGIEEPNATKKTSFKKSGKKKQ